MSKILKSPTFEIRFKQACENLESVKNCTSYFNELKQDYSVSNTARLTIIEENKPERKDFLKQLLLIILLTSFNRNNRNNINPYLLAPDYQKTDILSYLLAASPPAAPVNYPVLNPYS